MAFLGPMTVYTVYTCFADLVDSFARRQQNMPPVDSEMIQTLPDRRLCAKQPAENKFSSLMHLPSLKAL